MSKQERIVATIPKGPRNIVRVTLRMRGGRHVVDLRQFEPNGLRLLVPTMKGVSVDVAEIETLIAALETIRSECRSWK
jgi:hypothetical protein